MVLLAVLRMTVLISCKKEEKTPIIRQNIEISVGGGAKATTEVKK
jgi:hypothetical protein